MLVLVQFLTCKVIYVVLKAKFTYYAYKQYAKRVFLRIPGFPLAYSMCRI